MEPMGTRGRNQWEPGAGNQWEPVAGTNGNQGPEPMGTRDRNQWEPAAGTNGNQGPEPIATRGGTNGGARSEQTPWCYVDETGLHDSKFEL